MDKKKVEFIFLSEPDMIKAGVLDVKKCVQAMDETFKLLGRGDYVMGGHDGNSHGCMLWYPTESPFPNMPLAGPDRRYMAMPSYLGGEFNICAVKWYGSNIANPAKGLPRSILLVGLNDPDTGEPLAVMSANLLSAMRTGAVPGVATKYLARKDAASLAVLGCGVINRACVRGILEHMPGKKKMYLYDLVTENARKFAEEFEKEYELEIVLAATLEEALTDADVVSVATSGAAKVVVDRSWLKPGCLFTMTGTAQLDDQCYMDNKAVFDHWPMHKVWYEEGLAHKDGLSSVEGWASSYPLLRLLHEGKMREEEMHSLSDIANGTAIGRRDDKEIILLISGGLPVEDAAWGYRVYKQAVAQGLGQKLVLWEGAHWQ